MHRSTEMQHKRNAILTDFKGEGSVLFLLQRNFVGVEMFYSNQTDKWDWNLQWKEMLTCSHLHNSQELKDPYVC